MKKKDSSLARVSIASALLCLALGLVYGEEHYKQRKVVWVPKHLCNRKAYLPVEAGSPSPAQTDQLFESACHNVQQGITSLQ